jgi:hypothetical protein
MSQSGQKLRTVARDTRNCVSNTLKADLFQKLASLRMADLIN